MTEERGLSRLNSVELSQEDVAWADSLLSKDLDISDSGWDSFKDALLETLDAQNDSSPYGRKNPPEEEKIEIFSSVSTGNMHKAKVKTAVSFASSSGGADSVEDPRKHAVLGTLNSQYRSSYDRGSRLVLQPLVKEKPSSEGITDLLNVDNTPVSIEGAEYQTEDFWSTHEMGDVFLPTYDENLKDLGLSDPDVDFVFQEFQLEQSAEDIFKIWDFDIPPEENVLTKQLNKALAEISSEPTPLVSDDSEPMNGLEDVAIDGIISGIENLALSPNSG